MEVRHKSAMDEYQQPAPQPVEKTRKRYSTSINEQPSSIIEVNESDVKDSPPSKRANSFNKTVQKSRQFFKPLKKQATDSLPALNGQVGKKEGAKMHHSRYKYESSEKRDDKPIFQI